MLLKVGETDGIEQEMQEFIEDLDYGEGCKLLVKALREILQGSCDLALADDPDLNYQEAAEIIILLENLGTADGATQ
jgi:hypothetical protein